MSSIRAAGPTAIALHLPTLSGVRETVQETEAKATPEALAKREKERAREAAEIEDKRVPRLSDRQVEAFMRATEKKAGKPFGGPTAQTRFLALKAEREKTLLGFNNLVISMTRWQKKAEKAAKRGDKKAAEGYTSSMKDGLAHMAAAEKKLIFFDTEMAKIHDEVMSKLPPPPQEKTDE